MIICKRCGAEISGDAVLCPNCNCRTGIYNAEIKQEDSTLVMIIRALIIVSLFFSVILILPMAWVIPLKRKIFAKLDHGDAISTGLKLLTFFFVNPIAGILMFFLKDEGSAAYVPRDFSDNKTIQRGVNMKFCPSCGTGLANEAVVCPNCGSVVTAQGVNPPAFKLKTNRSLIKLILLTIITFGIYPIIVMSGISTDINIIASKYDGKKTMHYCLLIFVFSWLTFGIAPLIWSHRISERIGVELLRRNIPYKFSASDFWLWNVLGAIIVVGPFIYMHKLLKSMNLLCEDYNIRG
ncbi:MAG: DUF4234 domain-containing protein [Acutalibacteraceae bacterium]|jgi:RNA polymerase subunit RPABC4/transcription elongation factor Spt4